MEPTLESHRFETLATRVPESTANLCHTSRYNLPILRFKKKMCANGQTQKDAPRCSVSYHLAPNMSSFDDLRCTGWALTQVPVQVAPLEALKEDSDTC